MKIQIGDKVQVMAASSAFKFKTGIVRTIDYANNPNLSPSFGVEIDGQNEYLRLLDHELEVIEHAH